MTPDVARAFDALPPSARDGCLVLRGLIMDCAAEMPQIGRLQEALRWGQPAYLTPDAKAGSTIRLGAVKIGGFALFVHCQTSLLADFRDLAGDAFRYERNRAVVFGQTSDIKPDLLRALIRSTLTYHAQAKV